MIILLYIYIYSPAFVITDVCNLFVLKTNVNDSYQVGLNYDLIDSQMVDLNVTLGYRAMKVGFEDLNNLYTDLEFKGAFVGVIAHL